MATTISSEVKAFFTADTTGLVKGVNAAKAKMTELRDFNSRASNIKSSILDPGGAAVRGADTLVKKLKLSAVTTGALGAGVVAFASVLKRASAYAGEQADKFHDINETMRQASRINVFATSADGVDSLSQKLATLRGQASDARGLMREADPYGFGGGFLGTSKTVIGQFQSGLKESVGMGPYSNFDREDDEKKMTEMRLRINAQEQAKLTKLRSQATIDDLRITKERLGADRQTAQISSLELEKTRALAQAKEQILSIEDQGRVAQRYDVQIAALREEEQSDTRRNVLASRLLGIEGSISSEQGKKVRSAEALIDANKTDLSTMQHVTLERRRQLELESIGAQLQIRQARREVLMGKSPGEVNAMIRHDTEHRAAVARFDARQDRTDGLVNAQRDASGNITTGYDPITGMWRAPRAGAGRAQQGLSTGSLSDAPTSTTGGASFIHDADPGGGLHSGNTPKMFDRTSAAIALDKPTGAESALAKLRGDSAHDPSARLANATTFPDLAAGAKQEFGSGYRIHPDNQAKLDRQGLALSNSQGLFADKEHARYSNELVRQMKGNAAKGLKPGMLDGLTTGTLTTGNLNGGATPVGPQLARPAGHDNDVGHGHTLIAAQNKLIDAADISNQFLKQMQMDLSTMAANYGFA